MPTQNPRAFISHSTQDRAFVERFAADLRTNGVDAWYSGWEIKAGDSIRARLDAGLAECEIFIIVLSKASISRPWVQAELDAATVRKLDGKVQKIIPIKIDNCGELPPILGSFLWEDFSNKLYEVAFKAVLNSVFSVETKPVLGSIPDLPPLVAPRRTKISITAAIFWTAMAVAVLVIASKLTLNLGIPPLIGQIVAGVLLAGAVWLFFERVEAVLADDTRLEIAVWLLGVKKISPRLEPWPNTFTKVFDRVFGTKHLSWKCFLRSCVASYCAVAFCFVVWAVRFRYVGPWRNALLLTLICGSFGNLVPDYISLLETRWMLCKMSKTTGRLRLLLADASITMVIGVIGGLIADMSYLAVMAWRRPELCASLGVWNCFEAAVSHDVLSLKVALESRVNLVEELSDLFLLWLAVAFFTSIWLWLYAGSGFILKAARRFDIGFDWFNSTFDIEKHPLQSIGLVAGALVAVTYWTAVTVKHFFF